MAGNVLSTLGNTPVTSAAIASMYPDLRQENEKVRWLERHDEIIRLKRGMYVVNPDITGKPLSTELMANHLYAPSYVSMHTALRFYGLIPEAVYETQSMTMKRAKIFDTPYGRFSYFTIARAAFHVGVRSVVRGDCAFLMASAEKALCDLIANTPHLSLRYLKEARRYLEEDLRLDMDGFVRMDSSILDVYAAVGKKGNSIRTLSKLLKNAQ